jgi:AraC-like DNA-binding protein
VEARGVKHAPAESIRYGTVAGVPGIETLHARGLRRGFERHFHDTYAFGLVLEGIERCRTGRRQHFFEPGAVPLFNPGDVHDGGPAAQGGWSYRMVYVERSALPFAGEPVFPVPLRDDIEARRRVAALFDAIDCGTTLGIEASLHVAAQMLLGGSASLEKAIPSAAARRARERIEADNGVALRLCDLTAAADVSPSALLRAFEKSYGLTPHRYQHSCRIAKARRLIAAGRTLAEVAAACGYADQSHLNRWFLRIQGVTPGRYRRNILQDARPRAR